jgi:CheY-like chemotaxis protein/anti-sigma regulatory factor (Ser/Thr protein kinase)
VLINLVNNARQAMAAAKGQGTLRVASGLAADRAMIRITVADDGPGIPPDFLGRIFEPFFTTKPPGEGTGLGLPIAKGIVAEHGGKIHVESQPGRGTTFVLTLPVSDAAPAPPASAESRPVPAGLRVLVVDDEAAIRDLIAEALAAQGSRVETAATGRETLEVLSSSPTDVLILDVTMPEMTGSELWKQIKGKDPALARRTVFCTGDVAREDVGAFIEATGCPLVRKPFEFRHLFDAVAKAASR